MIFKKNLNNFSDQNYKKLNFKKIFYKNTCDFCENTTLHGLKYVADKNLKRCERCFFGVSIISVTFVLIYLVLRVYLKWEISPVIVGINPKRSLITNEPFPAVTICNLNQALKTKVANFLENSTEDFMLQLLCKREVDKIKVFKRIKTWNNMEQFVINISQNCENLLLTCRFNDQNVNCVESFHPLVTDGGLCCVFNLLHPQFMYLSQDRLPLTVRQFANSTTYADWSAENGFQRYDHTHPKSVMGTGESAGLSVVLNAQKDEYYCSSSSSVGFKLTLHTPNEWPNVKEMGIFIEPGKETKLRIKPEKIETDKNLKSLNPNIRGCLFENEEPLKFFTHYTQRNCELEKAAEMYQDIRKCICYYLPQIRDNITVCSPYHTIIEQHIANFSLYKCLPSCSEIDFHIEAFSTKISHNGFYITNKYIENFNDSYVQDNIAVVHMFFKENTFRTYKQMEFIGLSDFLSSIGGLMGLFLGFSFLSITEFIYYAILRPFRYIFEFYTNLKTTPQHLGNYNIRQRSSSIRKSKKIRKLFKKRHNDIFKSPKVYNVHSNNFGEIGIIG